MKFLKRIYHYLLAFIGSVIYRFPSKNIFVIGITGTKGKSTSVTILRDIMQKMGYKVATLSSVHMSFGDNIQKKPKGKVTMPGRFFIQKFLRMAINQDCRYAIIEITSQGVIQHRHRFIDFDIAAITNLHPEHIEGHGSFEAYQEAKADFFRYTALKYPKTPKRFFVNKGKHMDYFKLLVKELGFKAEEYGKDWLKEIVFNKKKVETSRFLESEFNLENATLASVIAMSQGVPAKLIREVLRSFEGMAGRMEWLEKKGIQVVIDFAHTPDSLEALYKYLKSLKPKNLIAVFGSCGFGRDKWKRPEFGRVSEKYCDYMYISNDDPGSEDPQLIADQIAGGISNKKKYEIILDRKEAIQEAIKKAKQGDIVALVGKGHEEYIRVGKTIIPWNEKAIASQILSEL